MHFALYTVSSMKLTTLCYPIIDGKVLLAMKKRGFGTGKWNGSGGKVEPGESIEEACRREVHEEIGIKCLELEKRGTINFFYEANPNWNNECHIFTAKTILGDPKESEEMLPAWYEVDKIPYDNMWDDDRFWLPNLLEGEEVFMDFYFDKNNRIEKFTENK